MADLRLIRADALKLWRRRGMLVLGAFLTAGSALVAFAVPAVRHAVDPAQYPAAGGLARYQNAIQFLLAMVAVAGAIVGATAGAQDIESDVFADLAATGRSRLALLAARLPGALTVLLPIAALTALVAAVGSITLAGSLPTPGPGAIVAGSLGLAAAAAFSAALGVGIAALVGTRGPVIGILLAVLLLVSPLLTRVTFLGNARELLPTVALDHLAHTPDRGIATTFATALAVVVGWSVAALAAGAGRTLTREV